MSKLDEVLKDLNYLSLDGLRVVRDSCGLMISEIEEEGVKF